MKKRQDPGIMIINRHHIRERGRISENNTQATAYGAEECCLDVCRVCGVIMVCEPFGESKVVCQKEEEKDTIKGRFCFHTWFICSEHSRLFLS